MAVQKGGSAPYAPASAVIEVIDGYRNRSPQAPFTVDVLGRLGISESLRPRTLQALKLLDLVDERGEPTQALVALRQAPSDEFAERLAEIVRAAYAEVFAYCDLATDSPERIVDAFRPFKPPSMRDRMVRLFYGLCEQSGIINEAPKIESQPAQPRVRRARPERGEGNGVGTGSSTPAPGGAPHTSPQPPADHSMKRAAPPDLHPALAGLLALIPSGAEPWSRARRDGFVRAWEAALDICHPVEEAAQDES